MGKKIIAVNAGPRKGWNTDTLITLYWLSRLNIRFPGRTLSDADR